MVTIADLESWEPSKITAVADNLSTRRNALTGLQGEVDAGKPPTSWVGSDSVSAEVSHNSLVNELTDQVGELAGVIAALDAAAGDITTAKSTLESALDRASSHGFDVDRSTGTVSSPKTYTDEDDRTADENTIKGIVADISSALTTAQTADDTLAQALGAAVRTTADASGDLADQGLYSELRGMTTQQQAQYLHDHPDRAGDLLAELPQATKKALGDLVAADIDALNHGEPSQDEIDRLNTELGAFDLDPTVMNETYQKLGPDGVIGTYSTVQADMRYFKNGDELAGKLRTGLDTASNSPGFPAEEYGKQLAGYATYSLDDDDLDRFTREYPGGGSNASTLAYLMQGSGQSDKLVLGTAEGLDHFERTRGAEDAQFWYGQNGYSPLDTGHRDGRLDYDDPMEAVMNNLAGRPQTAMQFFGDPSEGNDRQHFYFDERSWKHDGYGSISHVVDAIGTDPATIADNPKGVATVVGSYLDHVTNSDGFNAHDAKAASPYIGDLLKNYMPSVDDALQHHPGDENYDSDPSQYAYSIPLGAAGTLADQPRLFGPDVDKLLQVAMGTPDGMQHVAEGVGSYQQSQVNAITAELQAHPNDVKLHTQLQNVLQNGSYLQGAAEHAVGEVQIDGARSQDAQRAAFISMTQEAAGLVPLPGSGFAGDVISAGVGHVVDLAAGTANDHFANATEAAVADSNTRAADSLNRVEVNALLSLSRSGVIHLSAADAAQFMPGGQPIDPSTLSTSKLQDLASLASNNYLSSYVTTEDLATSYKDNFLAYYSK